MDKIILIAGGAFQGKSLISLKLASILNYSAVISTDLIRNFIRIKNPSSESMNMQPYLLTEERWINQKVETCNLLQDLIPLYIKRGEKVILEGVHFTEDFLDYIYKLNGHIFLLDNLTPFNERVEKKTITRTLLNAYDVNNPDWVESSSYIRYRSRFEEIHQNILTMGELIPSKTISFLSLEEAIKKILKELEQTKEV